MKENSNKRVHRIEVVIGNGYLVCMISNLRFRGHGYNSGKIKFNNNTWMGDVAEVIRKAIGSDDYFNTTKVELSLFKQPDLIIPNGKQPLRALKEYLHDYFKN